MKKSKLSRLAALLAAGALLLGGMFISCSSDDDSGSTPAPSVNPDDTDDTLDEIAGTYTFGDSTVEIAEDGTVTITASDGTETKGTATVDEDGKLTITDSRGSTLYTGTVDNGEIENVEDSSGTAVEVTELSFKSQTKDVDLFRTLTAINSASSDNESVATVSYNGTKLTITSKAAGSATLTVSGTTSTGTATGTIDVTVSSTGEITAGEFKKISETINVTGVSIDEPSEATIVVGKTVTLTATVTPTDATDKTVTWTITEGADYVEKTDNSDGSATLTGKAAGTVKVTATAGDKSDAVTVTVVAFGSLEGTIY